MCPDTSMVSHSGFHSPNRQFPRFLPTNTDAMKKHNVIAVK